MSSVMRDFWVDVVGVDKPRIGLKIQKMRIRPRLAANGLEEDGPLEFEPAVDTPDDQRDAANVEAMRTRTVERVQSLIEPFKKALMNQSPDAERLQQQFTAIGKKIEAEQFEEVAPDLDQFERLLDKQQTNGRPRIQTPQNGAAPGSQTRLGIGPTDIIPPIIPVIKDLLGPLSATCKVTNNTPHTLILDPASLKEEPNWGLFKQPPPFEIPTGKEEWIAINKSTLGLHFAGVEFKVRYFIDEQKTAWEMHFDNPRVKDSKSDAQVIGPNKDDYKTTASNGQGSDVVFLFTLASKGGSGPQPTQPTQPTRPTRPQSATATNTSCLITVKNDTQVALRLAGQSNEQGDFMTLPPASVPPGGSASFAYVQTPQETEPQKQGCKGSVTWEVGSAGAASATAPVWRCAWENIVAEKNSAQASLVPPAGFQSLAQIGQGDENVPVNFTISGGGLAPKEDPPKKDPPKEDPPKKDPPKKDEPEKDLEFNPPTEQKQPTLRMGDKGADGWVEYLQQRLNRRLNPSPGLTTDGNFGPATLKAVLAYQKQEKLQQDGVVGNQTWAALRLADAEGPSTDGRQPHTFKEEGLEARWLSEGGLAIYFASSDAMELAVVAVGDDTQLEGQTVNVFVTAPGSKRKGVKAKIGPALGATQTGQGNLHPVLLADFTKTFPSTPPGADVKSYVIEGYFDQALGGDFWTSTRDEIVVKP